MNEFELDPGSMSFTLVSESRGDCKACADNGQEIASIPFDRGFTKVYEVKRDIQPSKYELKGGLFKSSGAHGYEEIMVENKEHGDKIRKYSAEELEHLLSIAAERAQEAEKYGFGGNLVITRQIGGHGFFDISVIPIPKSERKSCLECEALQNIGDREVYRTGNFAVYVPFAPEYDFELVISPLVHRQFRDCDDVVLFDLAALVKKTLDSLKGDLTIAVVQDSYGHFKVRIVGGVRDAFDLLGIHRVKEAPAVLAKGLRDEKIYEKG